MHRLFDFWERYMRIPDDARLFLENHGQIKQYRKSTIFSSPDEPKYYWCFTLEGLVAGLHYAKDGKKSSFRWLSIPNSYFTGTEHVFTRRAGSVYTTFLKDSTVFQLRADAASTAQRRYTAVSEFFHILKQHQLTRLRNHVLLLQTTDYYERYRILIEEMPDIVQHCDIGIQQEYAHLSRGTFYRVKKRYLNQRNM
ncbi:hypothetical protein RYH73_06330 [Olivibacter sp. CPCC 100613]|uniref:hypothetical protein n=1 Tax=Olivibacter sp. CPCC 100613 TaxID=3079931 RepID=UPI002FF48ACA